MAASPAILAWLGAAEIDPADVEWNGRRDDPRFRRAMRACLGPICLGRRRFMSEHAGIRICPSCRAVLRSRYGVHFQDGSDAPP